MSKKSFLESLNDLFSGKSDDASQNANAWDALNQDVQHSQDLNDGNIFDGISNLDSRKPCIISRHDETQEPIPLHHKK